MVAQAQDTSTHLSPIPDGRGRVLTPQERGRLGGQATFARYGRAHYSKIGAVGFARAIEAGWGEYLLGKLAPSYRAKFGREPQLRRNKAGDAARAQARKATPTLGRCAWQGCTAQATERHHIDGWQRSAETCGLCAAHHDELEHLWREALRWHRPYARLHEPPTKRAIAISAGVGLDGAIPF
jgi:hypothetical protein